MTMRIATRRAAMYPAGAAAAAPSYPISFTTTKSGTVTFDLAKTGETPVWTPGDGSADVEIIDFSHAYDGGTYDGYADFADPGTVTAITCSGNSLTALDVSSNTALTSLLCSSNSLAALDVSSNTALKTLWCQSNSLTALNVSNTALTSLQCYSNSLTILNVSSNTALTLLYCYGNSLTTLNVSSNTALKTLQCTNNNFSEAVVDQILSDVDAYGTSNGTLSIAGTNSAPSAAGLADKATLEGRGWTVTVTA